MGKTRKLFTIGYEQAASKAVLDELEQAGVKLLVDVRAVAASRRPGFSKNQLAAGLDARGISYLHLRGLGTPKDGREAAAQRPVRRAAQDLRRTPEAAAQAGKNSTSCPRWSRQAGPVCILCYERDHRECHREQWIAEIIEQRDGMKVEDLAAKQV